MFLSAGILILVAFIAYAIQNIVSLAKNIKIAKASGIPHVVVPYYSYNRLRAFLLHRTLLRACVKLLGNSSLGSWRVLVGKVWPWKFGHKPFAALGHDTFLTVAPGGMLLQTADAGVAAQVFSRQTDFPKPSHIYESVDLYGENVVTSEGAQWRHHRKLMSPVFDENNNKLVWKQSLRDAQVLLSIWLSVQGKVITTLAQDTMLLSLSVIGHAGLGQTVEWPNTSSAGKPQDPPPSGHEMTFTIALRTLLHSLFAIAFLPEWFLRKGPFKTLRVAHTAYLEWGQYLREMISSKREALVNAESSGLSMTNDLLTKLLKEHEQPSSTTKTSHRQLTDSEVLGNLFIMVFAGHETSANSIHFCLALLAIHPHIQAEVQAELDQIFHGRTPDQWDYEKDLPKLLNSKLNAVFSEQLRLFAPTITIPKYTTSPQTLKVEGKTVTVPPKTLIRLCVPSIHRNPAFWPPPPTDPSSSSTSKPDVDAFRPNRWFNADGSWYQPPKGAYIPFSDGARACLGRRFAQVEVLAVLALILSSHSVELAVDESTGDEKKETLRDAWTKAKVDAETTMREKMTVVLTLQIQKGSYVPVTFVKRGEERFWEG